MKMAFADWLGLLFIALKLTHQIDWWWVWVLAPLWVALIGSWLSNKFIKWVEKVTKKGLQGKT
jgi:hypothetical protein